MLYRTSGCLLDVGINDVLKEMLLQYSVDFFKELLVYKSGIRALTITNIIIWRLAKYRPLTLV